MTKNLTKAFLNIIIDNNYYSEIIFIISALHNKKIVFKEININHEKILSLNI